MLMRLRSLHLTRLVFRCERGVAFVLTAALWMSDFEKSEITFATALERHRENDEDKRSTFIYLTNAK